MKTICITLLSCFFFLNASAQNPAFSYTNGSTNTVPGNPGQPAELYNGVPSGQSNQINTNTVIAPNSSFITTPTTNINYGQPQTSTLDNSYSTTPSNSMQAVPAYTPKNNFNHLMAFQDPARTPKYPKQTTHVNTVDGSSGKFKNPHVDHHKQSSFVHNSHHLKKTKHHAEKTSGKTYERVGNK